MSKQSKISLAVIGFLISLLPSTQAQIELNGPTPWEVLGNPFSQPNVTLQIGKNVFEWYGSGDVNNDEEINSLDLNAMNSGVQNDMADVDGDGIPSTQLDKNKLIEFLNGNIEYLPGHWNELKTPEERISWLEKMIAINDALSPGTGKGWICANYIHQMTFDFFGISNFEGWLIFAEPTEYSDEYLARYNIPLYFMSTVNTSGVGHAVAGALVGRRISSDSISYAPLEFKDYYFIGYNNDERVYPGNFNMNPTGWVLMGIRAYVRSPVTGELGFQGAQNIIYWTLDDGEATLEAYNPFVLILENPNIIKVHIGGIPDTLQVILNGLPYNYNCSPENLFNLGYDAIPDTTKENTILPISLEYIDSDTIRFSEKSYEFMRKFMIWIYSGGITKRDSIFQRIIIDNITSIKNLKDDLMPKDLKVYQNYPNPFNPSTTIRYDLPEYSADLSIKIYDQLGNEVRKLSGDRSAGKHKIFFDAAGLSSGVYLIKLTAGNFSVTKKMILLK